MISLSRLIEGIKVSENESRTTNMTADEAFSCKYVPIKVCPIIMERVSHLIKIAPNGHFSIDVDITIDECTVCALNSISLELNGLNSYARGIGEDGSNIPSEIVKHIKAAVKSGDATVKIFKTIKKKDEL